MNFENLLNEKAYPQNTTQMEHAKDSSAKETFLGRARLAIVSKLKSSPKHTKPLIQTGKLRRSILVMSIKDLTR